MIESIHMTDTKQEYISALQDVYASVSYPTYPAHSERLHLQPSELMYNQLGRLIVPHGIWDLPDSEQKSRKDQLPTQQEYADYLQKNIQLDSVGRPLHPYATDLLTNKNLGVFTNRGYYWRWGPNYTVDTVLMTQDNQSVLLIKRGDTGAWALPGGFLDPNEHTQVAASRELKEETGVVIDLSQLTEVVQNLVVADPRTTLNAWPETTCYKAYVDETLECKGLDDAIDAKWFNVEDALQYVLNASHKPLLKRAIS